MAMRRKSKVKIGGVYVQFFGTLKLFLQPHSLGFMRYRVIEGGLEPSTIARGLAKKWQISPQSGSFIPDKNSYPCEHFPQAATSHCVL